MAYKELENQSNGSANAVRRSTQFYRLLKNGKFDEAFHIAVRSNWSNEQIAEQANKAAGKISLSPRELVEKSGINWYYGVGPLHESPLTC